MEVNFLNNTLKELLTEYQLKREKAISDSENKKRLFYDEHEKIKELNFKINSLSVKKAKSILQGEATSDIKKINASIDKLKEEKNLELKKINSTENEFNPNFECKICNDTGYVSNGLKSEMCSCLRQKLFDAEYNKLNVYNIKNISFKDFSINKYSNTPNKEKYHSDISPRDNMKQIKEIVQKFINNFDDSEEKNLLFVGNTGLGKTFLSSCIANAIYEKGKTVLYQTSPVMLDNIIQYHMSKDSSYSNLLEHLLTVDLLIIDDLGTESLNSLKFSDLYTVINSRLLNQNNKITKTVISTNLELDKLSQMYGERIFSRFAGSYNICRFFGDDIRYKK